ncbi:uncharacterized protein J8A68_003044 [[Candida] subhashii]|uniref:Alpha/beta hydrolase fold-3 domain-containing protein n=1 Tax=[Candida] subhashii TaxID=561895 RepID=A0A8J5UN09_9ASCO|nr:uncharacterized protein J8A68_003044 [[Candida] subhashii]KAG7663392.1 hypothetical protein J8A68_003044 [[Candida] subhashii]
MISPSFLFKLAGLPPVVLKTVLQYYTVGTIYSNTNQEFENSLYKNILLSVEAHVIGNYNKNDMRIVTYEPIEKVIKKFRSNPMISQLRNFGKEFDDHSYWVHQADNDTLKEKGKVLVYLHGGGYLFNMFDSQFSFISALHYALDNTTSEKLSILVVDYSLTMFDHVYPTQIHETLTTYYNLVQSGYDSIHLIGDSAGSHLALTVARCLAYPQETRTHFSHFPQFPLSFPLESLPQPSSLILISPWPEPCTLPKLPPRHGINTLGDLVSKHDVSLGNFYLGENDEELINDYLTFTNTDFDTHWAEVEPINNGKTLILVGEREVLRDGVEDFYHIINKNGKVQYHVEKGGIHAGLVYVESLDYLSCRGGKRAVNGDFENKFGFNLVAKFLNQIV